MVAESYSAPRPRRLPQHTTHWSKYHPTVHVGPLDDCEKCEAERLEGGWED